MLAFINSGKGDSVVEICVMYGAANARGMVRSQK